MITPKVSKLKEIRYKRGFSARSLAEKAGLNASTVAGIEKTGHAVAPATAKALCDALDMPFDVLFSISESQQEGGGSDNG